MAQILSAALVEYIRSMDVDTKLFAIASQAGSSEVITLSHETLLALNVVNDGREPVKWTIESLGRGMYLKGEQETANGVNKFMIVCPADEPMFLRAIFSGGQNAEEGMAWPVNWLFVDNDKVRIDQQLLRKENVRGYVNLVYRLDDRLVTAIANANTVGVGLQLTTMAATFLVLIICPL